MELIDRNALLEKSFNTGYEYGEINVVGATHVKDATTIEATPIVHGKWIDSDEHKGYQVCSACCGCYVDSVWIDGNKWSFCPDCGARMDKK